MTGQFELDDHRDCAFPECLQRKIAGEAPFVAQATSLVVHCRPFLDERVCGCRGKLPLLHHPSAGSGYRSFLVGQD